MVNRGIVSKSLLQALTQLATSHVSLTDFFTYKLPNEKDEQQSLELTLTLRK